MLEMELELELGLELELELARYEYPYVPRGSYQRLFEPEHYRTPL